MGKWRQDSNRIFDLPILTWDEIANLHDLLPSGGNRHCRHCPDQVSTRLQYPGSNLNGETVRRMDGHTSKKSIRTDAQRKEDNRRWAVKYNTLAGIGG